MLWWATDRKAELDCKKQTSMGDMFFIVPCKTYPVGGARLENGSRQCLFFQFLAGSTKAFWSCHSATTRQTSRWNALLQQSCFIRICEKDQAENNFFGCFCRYDSHYGLVEAFWCFIKRVVQFLMSALLKRLHRHCIAPGRTWRSHGREGRWRLGLRNWQMPRKLEAESLRIWR